MHKTLNYGIHSSKKHRQYESHKVNNTATKGGAEFAGQENDGQRNFRGWKLQDWKMTDKSVADENVEHVVLTFKTHHTKLINVHDLGVSVSSSQFS